MAKSKASVGKGAPDDLWPCWNIWGKLWFLKYLVPKNVSAFNCQLPEVLCCVKHGLNIYIYSHLMSFVKKWWEAKTNVFWWIYRYILIFTKKKKKHTHLVASVAAQKATQFWIPILLSQPAILNRGSIGLAQIVFQQSISHHADDNAAESMTMKWYKKNIQKHPKTS